jgi:hypothetical protein
MLRRTSSLPDPRRHATWFLSSCRFIIPVLVLLLILSSCSHQRVKSREAQASSGTGIYLPDSDGDGILDSIDNCPSIANKDQADLNGDGWGDVCDDIDGDLIADSEDRWPLDPENDFDEDGVAADPFENCNFICADCKTLAEMCVKVDNCPYEANSDQADFDADGIGDVCDSGIGAEPPACHHKHNPCDPPIEDSPAEDDTDGDNIVDSEDLCPNIHIANDPNPPVTDPLTGATNHLNTDGDGYGDACDPDDDNDSICDGAAASTDPGTPGGGCTAGPDNCALTANTSQDDLDCDGQGDVCDTDRDGDGYSDADEISTYGTSPTNADSDGDGITDGNQAPACPAGLAAGPDSTPLGDPTVTIAFELKDVSGTVITDKWIPARHPAADRSTQWWEQRSQVTVIAKLQDPSNPSAVFSSNVTFEIIHLPINGAATNQTADTDNDFSFDAANKNDLSSPVTPAGSQASESLFSFDYGGSLTLKASTIYNGSPLEATIDLPLDSDRDGLPDAWENAHAGFNPANANTFSSSELDSQADIDTSLDNAYTGDGLTNFQEYRGIIFDPNNASAYHKRLNPLRKDLFVRGKDFANSIPPNTTSGVLPFSVDYAAVYGKPTGTPDAFEEAGIDVHDVTIMPSFSQATDPPNIDILVVTNKTDKNANGLIDTLVGLENGYINHPSSLLPRYWTWDLKGASYIGNANDYAIFEDPQTGVQKRGTETYHLCLMHYFLNRPYLEDTDNTSACSQGETNKLDKLGNVEDFYKENGTNPPDRKGNKREDRCISNSMLDGDRMNPNWKQVKWGVEEYQAGVKYSAFDADADGRVENPIVTNPAGLDTGGQDPGEYTPEQVQLHTVLHEMGHAVGMDEQHTSDSDCLMYEESINWDRAGHFSPAARSQILIHNKTESN